MTIKTLNKFMQIKKLKAVYPREASYIRFKLAVFPKENSSQIMAFIGLSFFGKYKTQDL